MELTLEGRHAIVVGGAQGIGRLCAHRLAAAGAAVTIADLNEEKTAHVVDEICGDGGSANGFTVDVTDPDQCRELMETGPPGSADILVNSAVLYRETPALDQDPDEWSSIVHVGLNAAFFVSQAFARSVRTAESEGTIVHISSVSATHPMAGKAAYGAAKGGLDAMIRSLAYEWGPIGIRVNGVAPGHVRTETINGLIEDGAFPVDRLTERMPLGRLAETGEIADAVVFLASDMARFVTGHILTVDGGYTANGDF